MLWKSYKNSDRFSMRVGKKTRAALQPRALLTLHFYGLFISTNAQLSVEIQSGRAAMASGASVENTAAERGGSSCQPPWGEPAARLCNHIWAQQHGDHSAPSHWLILMAVGSFITPTKSWTTETLLSWRDEFFKLDTYDFSRGSRPVTSNKN